MTDGDVALHEMSWWDRFLLGVEHHGNRLLRPIGTALYRVTRGRSMPRGVLLLTTRGRRTGRDHTVLLQAFEDGGWLVLVAANAGRPGLPDWYRNLLAAGTGEIVVRGRRRAVRPEPVAPEEARQVWPHILQVNPGYARFRAAAKHELPLVRLLLEPYRTEC
jgi:deazaflavin-dependent oxidoreductase (nitroreductase family)